MEFILNSKFFSSFSVEDLGYKVLDFGYDGIDINIREGHPIDPSNCSKVLPESVKLWQNMGLSCPLVTSPIDMLDPQSGIAQNLYRVCSDAGVPRIKIGFWRFVPGDDYWELIKRARQALYLFQKLSEKTGVQTCYQVHSGPNLGSNCSGIMHLLQDFDPKFVGAYPDIGHMALDGEDWDMGFSMLGDYLSVIGAKDAYHAPQGQEVLPPYVAKFVKLGSGSVDWTRCVSAVIKTGFEGPVSIHTEYDFDEEVIRKVGYSDSTPPNLDKWAKEDVNFLKSLIYSKS